MKKVLVCAFLLAALVPVWSGEMVLWETAKENGGWRAFGNGLLDASAQGDELKLAVDWARTTFGIGAVFDKALAAGAGARELAVEARTTEENGTVLAPEWLAGERAFRASPERQPTLTAEWETYTFGIPDDFPRLSGQTEQVTALRILFLNKDKPGREDVYFRNVRLVP